MVCPRKLWGGGHGTTSKAERESSPGGYARSLVLSILRRAPMPYSIRASSQTTQSPALFLAGAIHRPSGSAVFRLSNFQTMQRDQLDIPRRTDADHLRGWRNTLTHQAGFTDDPASGTFLGRSTPAPNAHDRHTSKRPPPRSWPTVTSMLSTQMN